MIIGKSDKPGKADLELLESLFDKSLKKGWLFHRSFLWTERLSDTQSFFSRFDGLVKFFQGCFCF